jgi:hypothetical protein
MDEVAFKSALSESRNGANFFVRHWANRQFQYSDGVQELAKAGWFWLLDILATETAQVLRKTGEPYGIVKIKAEGGQADIELSIEDDAPPAWSKHIDMTDTPDGEYTLYLADEGTRYALTLMTEY